MANPNNTNASDKYVIRFTLNERIQHIILFLTLIVLAITGLSLKFHNFGWAQLIIRLEGGFEARGTIHRWAAIVLTLLGVYHFMYVVFTRGGHEEFMKMVPRLKDFKDFVQTVRFYHSDSAPKPEFDKFDFRQKIQYNGAVWGCIIMIFTGFILWFETQSMAVMPKWLLDVTKIVHSGEGVIIFVVLLLWHLYNVHLNPTAFPMDKSWLTGKISKEALKDQHTLEYRKIYSEEGEK